MDFIFLKMSILSVFVYSPRGVLLYSCDDLALVHACHEADLRPLLQLTADASFKQADSISITEFSKSFLYCFQHSHILQRLMFERNSLSVGDYWKKEKQLGS